jgi:hypothetical protein
VQYLELFGVRPWEVERFTDPEMQAIEAATRAAMKD